MATVGTPPEGWDIQNPDNVHQCGVVAASDFSIATAGEPSKTRTITTSFVGGPNPIQTVEFIVNGQVISAQPGAGGLYSTSYAFPDVGSYSIQIRVTDSLYYQATSSGKTVLIGS